MLAWLLCDFSGDPDQYCKETLYFYDFSGGPDPLSPALDPPMKVRQVACEMEIWMKYWLYPISFKFNLDSMKTRHFGSEITITI